MLASGRSLLLRVLHIALLNARVGVRDALKCLVPLGEHFHPESLADHLALVVGQLSRGILHQQAVHGNGQGGDHGESAHGKDFGLLAA
eukprot:CAMPEP_0204255120 /NCGR_PEP_ID=MMETSP0468-20130131/3014_1 /ASSEMBLY_ACC=CAM_ASM_000383 /TAXON_ID=2969 /ORGANISM="Oxyrrhis marina" /LENGTH=87 /DNA_ID=CAMNT_0051228963 /DNA_START=17 /DNA_END=280 /DNA_ORIENTATION=+